MAIELFKADQLNLAEVLLPNEQILALDGFHSNIFIGTNLGRLCHFKYNGNAWVINNVLMTIKQTPIVQVIVTTALGYIMIVSDKTLYFIDIEIYKIVSSSGEGHVKLVALNMDPVADNPFILQLAIIVSATEIWVCEKFEDNFDTKFQIPVDSPIHSLYYTRYCLCFATDKEYFVRDLLNKTSISLFPFDNTVMRPLVTGVGSEEVVLCGMQNLLIFANKEGVSSRPPIFVSTGSIVSFAFVSPFIFVLTETGLSVYNIDSQQLKQTLHIENGLFLSNVDGTIFLVQKNRGLLVVSQVLWTQQVEEKMKESIDSALKLAKELLISNSLENNYSAIQKFKEFQQKAAFIHLSNGNEKESLDLLIESEADPQKVIEFAGNLDISNTTGTQNQQKVSLDFLEAYLTTIKSHEWATHYQQSIDVSLSRVFVLKGKADDIFTLESTSWNDECYRKWLEDLGRFNLAAKLSFDIGLYHEAFSIWKKLVTKEINDSHFDVHICFECLKQIDDPTIWHNVLEWLILIDPNRCIHMVIEHDQLSVDKVLNLFEKNEFIPLPYLRHIISKPELYKRCSLSEKELYSKLFCAYIDEIKTPRITSTDDLSKVRKQFRQLIFDYNFCNVDELLPLLINDKNLTVESILLQSKKGNPTEFMKMLVHLDLSAAELLCTRLPAYSSSLLPILLNAYAKSDRSNETMRNQIAIILSQLDSSIDPKEVLQNLPQDMSCSEVANFLKRSMVHRHKLISLNKLRTSIEQNIMEELEIKLSTESSHSFTVTEETLCSHCNQLIGKEDIVWYPNSKKLAHKSCHYMHWAKDDLL